MWPGRRMVWLATREIPGGPAPRPKETVRHGHIINNSQEETLRAHSIGMMSGRLTQLGAFRPNEIAKKCPRLRVLRTIPFFKEASCLGPSTGPGRASGFNG